VLIAETAERAGMPADAIFKFRDAAEAADAIPKWLKDDDLVLLKGSRSMHLEYVDAALKKSRNDIEAPPTKAAS
jgi:UDP-N-acetylmuramyl pentapeptide synthase